MCEMLHGVGWWGGCSVLEHDATHTHTHTHGGGNTHVACTHTLYHMDAGHMSAQEFRQSRESHLSTNRSSVQRYASEWLWIYFLQAFFMFRRAVYSRFL